MLWATYKIFKMKKLTFLFSLLITAYSFGQTSIYHPFPDSNAYWNFGFIKGQCILGESFENYSIYIGGDSAISGQTYQKLSTPYVIFNSSGSCVQEHFAGYKGAIRQDIPNKKVYFIPPMFSSEYLLYDFNMTTGDTVEGFITSFTEPDTVIAIDSILVGDNFRKRWLINDWYEIYYIEGIGSTYGLLEASPGYSTDADMYSLDCFIHNDQSLYPDTNTNCQLITSVNDNGDLTNQVKVFPNPSNGTFFIEFDSPNDIREIQLADLVGNIIFRKEINNEKQAFIKKLAGGTYILILIDKNNRTANEKIISCP